MSDNNLGQNVFCHYFQKEMPALDKPPAPGALGLLIQKNISQSAWDLWIIEQVKFINENQLQLNQAEDREKVKAHRQKFLKLDLLKP